MLIYLLKLVSAIVLVIFQYSFLNYLFPLSIAPNIILVAIVVLVVDDGFDVWPWVVFMGVLVDILSFSVIGRNVIILISAAYLINLISRSFLLDQHEKKILPILVLLLVMTFFVNIFSIIWSGNLSLMNLGYLKGSFGVFLRSNLVQVLFEVVIFYLIYGLIEKVKRNILLHNKSGF